MWNMNPPLSCFCTLCSVLLDPSPACSSSLLLLSFWWSEGKNPGTSGRFAAGDKGGFVDFLLLMEMEMPENSQSPQSPGKAQENEKYIFFFFPLETEQIEEQQSMKSHLDFTTHRHSLEVPFDIQDNAAHFSFLTSPTWTLCVQPTTQKKFWAFGLFACSWSGAKLKFSPWSWFPVETSVV